MPPLTAHATGICDADIPNLNDMEGHGPSVGRHGVKFLRYASLPFAFLLALPCGITSPTGHALRVTRARGKVLPVACS